MAKSTEAQKKVARPSLREEQKQLTRERLLDAAVEVFEEVGFRSATIDEIASRAGANRTTVYLHFKDKVEIGSALSGRLMNVISDYYTKMGDMRLSRPAVVKWIAEMVAHRKRYAVLFEVAHEAATSDRAMSAAQLKFHRDVVKQYWAPLLNRQTPEKAEELILRIMLLNTMQDRFLFLASTQGSPISVSKAAESIAALWWEAIFKDA